MENVILVDKNNNPIGLCEKLTAHRKGLLHRAFSILIYNEKREILLQKRSKTKYHTPGLWTNTCCSHPLNNETYTEATHRRLMEEMGMTCNLNEDFSFIYFSKLNSNLYEHEHDTVFLGETNAIPKINKIEVSEFKYINYYELKNEIKLMPNNFTPWFKTIIHKLDEKFFNFNKFFQYA